MCAFGNMPRTTGISLLTTSFLEVCAMWCVRFFWAIFTGSLGVPSALPSSLPFRHLANFGAVNVKASVFCNVSARS